MKILIVSESLPPVLSGVAVVVARSAEWLAWQGHQVAVLTAHHPDRTDGYPYLIAELKSRPNPWRPGLRYAVAGRREIERVFDDLQPDVVHVHDPGLMASHCVAVARSRGIAVMATHHFIPDRLVEAYAPFGFRRLAAGLLWRRLAALYGHCQLVTAPSAWMADELRRRLPRIPAERIRVVSNGVDSGRFAPATAANRQALRKQRGLSTNRLVAGYVGRLDKEKDVAMILSALARFKQEVELVVFGQGNAESALRDQARDCGLPVYWLSAVSSASGELAEAYRLMDMFIIASPIETESLVTLEAMASGLPVIARNVGALPELVRQGENGFLFNDAQGLFDAVTSLRNASPEERERMGVQSRAMAKQRDLAECLKKMEGLYGEVRKESAR